MKKNWRKQQLYTEIEQTLLSLRAGYTEHQQVLQQLSAETLVLKESERKWEEGKLISVFQLMEARNRLFPPKAELVSCALAGRNDDETGRNITGRELSYKGRVYIF